ncbi:MAG: hypothetical protein HDT42_08055 [Ruminococcaceae bacterium]|nr:hypothetical protein [Oscillospiraceae bacterium]
MSKFVIECPHCGSYAEGKTGFLARKKIDCACGYTIDVRTDKMTTRTCPHCGNTAIYDQTKGTDAMCPVCHQQLVTQESLSALTEFTCPSCSCKLSADKNAKEYTCPLCDTVIDVQQQIAANNAKSGGMPSVIECKMDNTVFVKRHPIDNFVTGSKLIVHESQEAVFFKDGAALDTFGSGGHVLTTDRLPLLNEVAPLPFSNGDPFRTEIYFVNKTEQKEIKWGTPDKIGVQEPKYKMYIDVGAFGTFNMVVKDARRFLIKNIGTIDEFKQKDIVGDEDFSTSSAAGQFKDLILNKIVDVLANTIEEQQLDIFLLDKQKDKLAAAIRDVINIQLEDYGLFMPQFYIRKISLPEDDPNFKRMREKLAAQSLNALEAETAETERAQQITRATTAADVDFIKAQNEARKKLLMEQTLAAGEQAHGEAEANVMKAKGMTYQDETARQVGLAAMQNGITGNGSGGGVSGGIGDIASLGVTLGTMGGIMNMTRDALNPIMNTASSIGGGVAEGVQRTVALDSWNCSCGEQNITSKCCPECGAKRPAPPQSWDCSCGCKNITSKFCPDCGTKKPEPPAAWDCPTCGYKGITSKFCPDCGAKKPDSTTP